MRNPLLAGLGFISVVFVCTVLTTIITSSIQAQLPAAQKNPDKVTINT
jgi:hypothetical protein